MVSDAASFVSVTSVSSRGGSVGSGDIVGSDLAAVCVSVRRDVCG